MSLLFIFFVFENIFERFIPVLSYSDEALTIIFLVFLLSKSFRIKYSISEGLILLLTIGIIVIGWVGNRQSAFPISGSYQFKDALQVSKFFLLYISTTKLFPDGMSDQTHRIIVKFSKCYLYVLAFFGILSQFIPLGMTGDVRFGIKSFLFLYSHQTFLVSSVVALLAVLFSDNWRKHVFAISCGYLVLLLSMRSKAVVFVLAITFLAFFLSSTRADSMQYIRKHRLQIFSIIILVILTTAFLMRNKVELYLGYGMSAARPALYFVSFMIAKNYFPFGTGLATFASYLSIQGQSPVYWLYGIQNVNGLNRLTDYAYVSDTYWPYIIGEFGVLGFVVYIFALLLVLKHILHKYGNSPQILISVISVELYIFTSCFTESLLTNSNIVILTLCLSYFCNPRIQTNSLPEESRVRAHKF